MTAHLGTHTMSKRLSSPRNSRAVGLGAAHPCPCAAGGALNELMYTKPSTAIPARAWARRHPLGVVEFRVRTPCGWLGPARGEFLARNSPAGPPPVLLAAFVNCNYGHQKGRQSPTPVLRSGPAVNRAGQGWPADAVRDSPPPLGGGGLAAARRPFSLGPFTSLPFFYSRVGGGRERKATKHRVCGATAQCRAPVRRAAPYAVLQRATAPRAAGATAPRAAGAPFHGAPCCGRPSTWRG
jgi:hypothetical protein